MHICVGVGNPRCVPCAFAPPWKKNLRSCRIRPCRIRHRASTVKLWEEGRTWLKVSTVMVEKTKARTRQDNSRRSCVIARRNRILKNTGLHDTLMHCIGLNGPAPLGSFGVLGARLGPCRQKGRLSCPSERRQYNRHRFSGNTSGAISGVATSAAAAHPDQSRLWTCEGRCRPFYY